MVVVLLALATGYAFYAFEWPPEHDAESQRESSHDNADLPGRTSPSGSNDMEQPQGSPRRRDPARAGGQASHDSAAGNVDEDAAERLSDFSKALERRGGDSTDEERSRIKRELLLGDTQQDSSSSQ